MKTLSIIIVLAFTLIATTFTASANNQEQATVVSAISKITTAAISTPSPAEQLSNKWWFSTTSASNHYFFAADGTLQESKNADLSDAQTLGTWELSKDGSSIVITDKTNDYLPTCTITIQKMDTSNLRFDFLGITLNYSNQVQ